MANVDYDRGKFWMDAYGNLIPRKFLDWDKAKKELEDETDASEEVER